jgi:hypothetical protein
MKIRVTVRETVYKTLEVDTIDFGMEETTTKQVFELAETINDIKENPNGLLNQYKDEVDTQKEINSVEIVPID